MINLPTISIIVIGFNEAKNLHQTFNAINEINYPMSLVELIYVDSGSKDDSIEIALKYTSKVYIEDKLPSAARNRNRGAKESTSEIIHFIDGDVIIGKNYIINAVQVLSKGNVQAVCGKLIESKPNWITNIITSNWHLRKEGFIDSTHAGGTYLKNSFLQINGYNTKIKLGEETELGHRFKDAGFNAFYVEEIMGYHDYGITNIFQYLKKQIGNGKFKMEILFFKESNKEIDNLKKISISNLTQMSVIILILIILLVYYPMGIVPLIILYLLFPIFKSKIKNTKQSLILMALNHYSKPFIYYGQIRKLFEILSKGLHKTI